MTNPESKGPNIQNLRALRSLLPQMAKGMRDGSLRGKGRKMVPRRMCKVCSKLFDWIKVPAEADTMVQGDFCNECDTQLKAGMVAIVSGNRAAFLPASGSLLGEGGNIMHVSDHVMDAVEVAFKKQVKKKEPNDDR